jgi:spore coat protein CotF
MWTSKFLEFFLKKILKRIKMDLMSVQPHQAEEIITNLDTLVDPETISTHIVCGAKWIVNMNGINAVK